MQPNCVWRALRDVPWATLTRVHGNAHSTMIGLITQWWVGLRKGNLALDGAPGYCSRKTADAVLCHGSAPVGVLEVEGKRDRYEDRAQTIGNYMGLCPDLHPQLDGIRFGLLLLYPVSVTKTAGQSDLLGDAGVEGCLRRVERITRELPGTQMLVVTVDKRREQQVCPVRSISKEYHGCTVSRVRGIRFAGGVERSRATFVG